ncbi:MAG TPA: ATP-binding protein [Casimicrobiaceae bacterium]|nr:ATP-binding protein [Casimicrobiaceae bacterium]
MTSPLRFLLDFEAALRASLDAPDIAATATRLLGVHLDAGCAYAVIDTDGSQARLVGQYAATIAPLRDAFALDDLGDAVVQALGAGRVHAIDDREHDGRLAPGDLACRAAGVRALMATPLLQDGRLAAMLLVRAAQPRQWRDEDVDLARLVARRCFESIERLRTMHEAPESAAQVRLVADNVPAKISYVDRNLHYRFNNAAYADWYGVDNAAMAGRHVREVLGDATYFERLPYMQRALAGETVSFKSRSEHRRLGMRMTDISCVPDIDRNGEVRGFYVMSVDTTERQQAEERLRENDRRKDEFLAMLAHELRNPLAPLSNALHLWPALAHDPSRMADLRTMMERQVRQLTRLLDDLLDVSRIRRGRIELRRRPVRLAEVIDGAIEAVRPLIERNGHVLAAPPTSPDLWLTADVARLAQIFDNVLGNAVKYTPEGGRIALWSERDGNDVVVHVTDNGRGIPPGMLGRVFEMFVQVEPTLENAQGGMGIGLALSRLLVEMHGGSIAAFSAGVGHGTEIVVRLPLSAGDDRAQRQGPPASAHRGPMPTRRVLVVDDMEASANTLGAALRAMGHDVAVALDGDSAIDAAQTFRPDVVFLDIAMPQMNGYEVARRLRASSTTRDALIVALTGFAQEDDYRRTREAGFDDHLVKPASMHRIEALLAGGARTR